MEQKDKPWPEYPPVLKERVIIQRGLQFYFSCVVCEELGWKVERNSEAKSVGDKRFWYYNAVTVNSFISELQEILK